MSRAPFDRVFHPAHDEMPAQVLCELRSGLGCILLRNQPSELTLADLFQRGPDQFSCDGRHVRGTRINLVYINAGDYSSIR